MGWLPPPPPRCPGSHALTHPNNPMSTNFLLSFAQILIFALQVMIFIRVILSWVKPHGGGTFTNFVTEVTDPILKPLQRIIPSIGGLDLSPILALVLLKLLENVLLRALG